MKKIPWRVRLALEKVLRGTDATVAADDERINIELLNYYVRKTRRRKLNLEDAGDREIYKYLTSFYIHQDQLSWSRLQTLIASQAAVIGGSYVLKGTFLSPALLVFGAVSAVMVWILVERDWENRDQNLDLLDEVHGSLGIMMSIPPRGFLFRGSLLVRLLMTILVAIDISLAARAFFLARH